MNSFSLVSAAPAYGGSAEPCEAIGASLRTQVRILLPFYRTGKSILSFHVKHFFVIHKKMALKRAIGTFYIFYFFVF